MNRTSLWIGCCWAVAAAGTAAIIGWNMHIGWRFGLAFVVAASIGGAFLLFSRQQQRQRERMLQETQLAAIHLMNHQRHDWMNDLQLLYGYVRLKKYDKLPDCVETIKERMAEESRIAKLGFPELVMFLMQHRTSGGTMPLKVMIPEPLELDRLNLEVDTVRLTNMIIETVNTFRFASKEQGDVYCPLQLAIWCESSQLNIQYQLEGKLLRPGEVAEKLRRIAMERGVRLEQLSANHHDGQDAYQIVVPCSA
ncbi:Spo0B domain-containing protein [Paenibacillus sp. chi10]|uniref:Spo0B domain-containing protein n=1 Tax=Paenibacillus suaedae TaxID=3077233 RepID=A0AAJ2JZJ8_9BACL|nr:MULTISPECIES: Spo0B domain-containing protein [unclassified Paenibacillus]MDT8979743.1 Spo0B domain-containing protein [Paenibacillus sp. chi10]